jgi:hypothetical protein
MVILTPGTICIRKLTLEKSYLIIFRSLLITTKVRDVFESAEQNEKLFQA